MAIVIIIITLIGALLHFVYAWSHCNKIVAIFAAVNESTWEHIKIGMTPTILWCLYYAITNGINTNFWVATAMCLLTIILVIPILFYAYTGFTKRAILPVDIVCFFLTITISQVVFHYFININKIPSIYSYLSIILILIELFMYARFTFYPPKNFIFKDPITNKYGLSGHSHHHHHD